MSLIKVWCKWYQLEIRSGGRWRLWAKKDKEKNGNKHNISNKRALLFYSTISSAALYRAECALFVAISIWSVNSLSASSLVSQIGSTPSLGCCPLLSMKGVVWVEEWIWLLHVNSARETHSYQSSWHWLTNSLRYCSISWLIHSVWPSVYGWYAVEAAVLIPKSLLSLFMNWKTNWVPWSHITSSGSSWCLYM